MAYVLFTPPTRDAGMVIPTSSRAKRAIGRIAQPLKVGKSLLRTDGTWRLVSVPSTDETLAVDTYTDGTVLYFAGGHQYVIDDAILYEIEAQGIDVDLPDSALVPAYPGVHPVCYPTAVSEVEDDEPPPGPVASSLPSDSLLPSDTLYPGEP